MTSGSEKPDYFIDKSGWISLICGFICALIPFFWGSLRWIMSYLKILIHEIGHSVIAWLFGYPCVPTFNLRHGGGLAVRVPQANWLLAALAIVFIIFVVKNYRNIKAMVITGICLAVYLLCFFTSLHNILELYMGHGFEILFATVFIYCAASNWMVHHFIERILYAFIGFYLLYENIIFSWRLLFDKAYRAEYFSGIAPGLLNDFYIIWAKYLNTSFGSLVVFHLILTLLSPAFAIGLYYIISRARANSREAN